MGADRQGAAALTADQDGIGCAKLVVFCNAVEDNPFMAGAFHGAGEADAVINVGVRPRRGARTPCRALPKGQPFDVVAETVKKTAFQITRMGQLVARRPPPPGRAKGIVDLSLAPTPAIGDSVARILEEMGLEPAAHGTTAALALLNDAVKKGGVMASPPAWAACPAPSSPCQRGRRHDRRRRGGALALEKLEAMTCVCSVGLDMIAIPGDTPAETISASSPTRCAIGMINNKTTAVRVIPAIGKGVGDWWSSAACWACARSCR